MHFFSSKKLANFLVVALKTQRPPTPLRLFHCQNKTHKAVRYGKICITEAKQSNRQGLSQGGGSSSQVILPGAPWSSAATVY